MTIQRERIDVKKQNKQTQQKNGGEGDYAQKMALHLFLQDPW